MNQPHPSLSPLQLEVFVLQHHGQDVDYAWQWPAGASESSFDSILNAMEGAGAQALHQPLQCSLRCVGAPEQPLWLLVNNNPELVCTVNHQLLDCGSQLRLGHGDEIELGLTRLVVSLAPSQSLVDPAASEAQALADAGQPSEADQPAFDLKDLAIQDRQPMDGGGERYGHERSGFSDLISQAPEMHLTSPAPLSAPALPAAAPAGLQARVEDPLQALHTQYLARLRDPVQADAQDRWQELTRGDQARPQDPMQQWMQAAGGSHSLDDLLGQSHSISAVISRLDALGTTDVLAPEPFESVMHLFAPGPIAAPAQAPLQSLVQHSLPGLTRREHHSVSIDSAMPLTGGAQPPSETPSP